MKEYHKETQVTRRSIKQLIALDIKEETNDKEEDSNDDNEFKTLKSDESIMNQQKTILLSNENNNRLEIEYQLDIIKCPFRKIAEICVSLIFLFIISLLKGSDNVPSFLQFEA